MAWENGESCLVIQALLVLSQGKWSAPTTCSKRWNWVLKQCKSWHAFIFGLCRTGWQSTDNERGMRFPPKKILGMESPWFLVRGKDIRDTGKQESSMPFSIIPMSIIWVSTSWWFLMVRIIHNINLPPFTPIMQHYLSVCSTFISTMRHVVLVLLLVSSVLHLPQRSVVFPFPTATIIYCATVLFSG